MSKNETILLDYPLTFHSFPLDWVPFLTGMQEKELKRHENVLGNNIGIINFAPELKDFWAPLRDLHPSDVKAIFIGSQPLAAIESGHAISDGMFCGSKTSCHPATSLVLRSVINDSMNENITSNDHSNSNMFSSLIQNRSTLNDWGFKLWKFQGVLFINAQLTCDKYNLSRTALNWNNITLKIIINILKKYKTKSFAIVYFGSAAENEHKIPAAVLRNCKSTQICKTEDPIEAVKVMGHQKIFLSNNVFSTVNKFLVKNGISPIMFM
jgi:uracil DNA glycosylase